MGHVGPVRIDDPGGIKRSGTVVDTPVGAGVVETQLGTTRPPRKLLGIEVPVVKPVAVTAVVFNVRVLAAPENPIFAVATQAVVPVPGCTPRALQVLPPVGGVAEPDPAVGAA